MHALAFFLIPAIFLSGILSSNIKDDFAKDNHFDLERLFVNILFDSVKSNELKQKNFCLMIWANDDRVIPENYESIPFYIVIWFDYASKDKHITLKYIPFLGRENFDYSSLNAPVRTFLKGVVDNKKIVNTDLIKQFRMPMPKGLQNDILFYKMRDRPKLAGLTKGGDIYHYGFKSNKDQFIINNGQYYDFSLQVHKEILKPIKDAVCNHAHEEDLKRKFGNTGEQNAN